jgi:hypothetical protein
MEEATIRRLSPFPSHAYGDNIIWQYVISDNINCTVIVSYNSNTIIISFIYHALTCIIKIR